MAALPHTKRGGSPQDQQKRATATRDTILAVARALFAEAGYHATATTEIAARAGLTRGALYHHFDDKEALFLAVSRLLAEELAERSSAAAAGLSGNLWAQVTEAFRTYLLLIVAHADYRRILLIDGPAILGWVRWREVQADHVANRTADALQLLMDADLVEPRATLPLATMIQAALHDAALTMANAPETGATRDEALATFLFILRGIGR
ncbi:helix-turn-helix domain-containing protein [Sphingomonas sp. BIUV-7]|uniref:Helix-turn-helix domain-containing protein n=1 Tax=Sphingomonas natans TaxID=3063330 RepID=A0ABT8Y833_9SPHN|nr:TetR/AcrR family transcriptional regulator [Sphingomonas sp. BIUV-7]MDO6414486.1 helix-turn-helix domain-containing protein [Sphingomonas sp. BIUV-7]